MIHYDRIKEMSISLTISQSTLKTYTVTLSD